MSSRDRDREPQPQPPEPDWDCVWCQETVKWPKTHHCKK